MLPLVGASIQHCLGKRGGQPRKPPVTTLEQSLHATAVQPQQADGKLAKIVAVGADGKPACTAQRVGRLLLQSSVKNRPSH